MVNANICDKFRFSRQTVRRNERYSSFISTSSIKPKSQTYIIEWVWSYHVDEISFYPSVMLIFLLDCTDSSSEEESIIDNGDDKLLKRIFRELKHTQSNVKGARTENQDIFHKITKLTQKINQFKSLVFSVRIFFYFRRLTDMFCSLCRNRILISISIEIRIKKKHTQNRLWVFN